MKLSQFMEGLQILQPHYKDGDGYHLGAEHDEFFAYATDTPLTDAEVARMKELGWHQFEMESEDPYDPSEGWGAFV